MTDEEKISIPDEVKSLLDKDYEIKEDLFDASYLDYLFIRFINNQKTQCYVGINNKNEIRFIKELFLPLIRASENYETTNELLKEGTSFIKNDLLDKLVSQPNFSEESITYELHNNKVSIQLMINLIPIIDDIGEIIEIISRIVPFFIPYYYYFSEESPDDKDLLIATLNQLPIGIILLDAEDNIVYFNLEAASILGSNLIEEEVLPLYSEKEIKLKTLLKTTNYNILDYPVKTKFSRTLLINVKQTKNSNFKIVFIRRHVKTLDVSIYDELGKEEEIIMDVFDKIGDALIIFERDINLPPKMNNTAREIFTEKVSLINPFGNFYSPKLYSLDGKELEIDELPTSKVLNGVIVNDVYTFISEDGKKHYLKVIGTPIKSGNNVIRAIVSFKDITDWFDRYLEIREKREIFEKLIDFVGMAIILGQVGQDKPLYANKKAKELFIKYANGEESITQLLMSFDFYSDTTFIEDKLIDVDLATMVLATGACPKRMIYNKSKREERYMVSSKIISLDCGVSINLEYDSNNIDSPCFLLIIKTPSPIEENIAALLEIQDQLRYFNLELHKKKIAQLRAQKQISNLAANLNQLLSDVIKSLSEYIDKLSKRIEEIKKEREIPEETAGDILIIKNAYKELSTLFSDLMTAAQAILPRIKLEKVNIKSMILQILRTMAIPTEHLILDLDDIEIITDPLKLRIAIQNLISNAVKFANPENPKIEITARKIEKNVIITVRDNGPGIPEGAEEIIFHPFKKLNEEKEGTGTGLYLVRRTLSTINGSIKVRNREEGGAEFTITLYS